MTSNNTPPESTEPRWYRLRRSGVQAAAAVAIAAGISASTPGCSLFVTDNCDTDVSLRADPAADPSDIGPAVYDTSDSDVSSSGDSCDAD